MVSMLPQAELIKDYFLENSYQQYNQVGKGERDEDIKIFGLLGLMDETSSELRFMFEEFDMEALEPE